MAWSGGTFTRARDWTADDAAGETMDAVLFDQEDDNFESGINNCLTKDGQNSPTADLPMGGNRHTGVGNADALDTYASAADVIDQDLVYYVDTGTADTYVITPSPAITAYEEGQKFVFRATNANTGASTLNVNALGAIALQTNDGNALISGMIVDGGYYEVVYDANTVPDRFVLVSPHSLTGGLTDIAGLAVTDGNFIVGDGSNWVAESGATARASIGANSATNLTAGTLPDARLSSNVPLLDQSNTFTGGSILTVQDSGGAQFIRARHDGILARVISSGVLQLESDGSSDVRLNAGTGAVEVPGAGGFSIGGGQTIADSDNIALRNAANTFTASGVGASDAAINIENPNPHVRIEETDASANEGVWLLGAGADTFHLLTRTDADATGESALDVTRTGTGVSVVNIPNGTLQYGGEEVGYRGLGTHQEATNYEFVLADAGTMVEYTSSGHTFTIPANASTAFPVGTVITVINDGTGNLTIAITSDTLVLAGTGSTGSRTVAQYGVVNLSKVDSTKWYISGTGVS